jgi:hypothetical protein
MRTRIAGIGIAAAIAAGTLFFLRGADSGDLPTTAAPQGENLPVDAPADSPADSPTDPPADLPPDASDPATTAWVCAQYSERVNMLMAGLDLERAGLEVVRGRVRAGQLVEACDALLRYYREGDSASWLRRERPPLRPGHYKRPDQAMADTVFVSYVQAEIPRRDDGGIDWAFSGPGSTPEYRSQFNALIHVSHLYEGYLASGDAKYAKRMDADIRDWILSNPYPGPVADGTPWEGHWSAQRIDYFGRWLFGLIEEPAFTDATRILILASVVEHGDLLRYNHSDFGNHLIMEMTGLARAGATWPELQLSGEWVDYAHGVMQRELDVQVYPDGTQYELTSHYHTIVANQYEAFMEQLGHAGRDAGAMRATVEKMWDYVAWTMRPTVPV